MGCAAACAASILGISYKKALNKFKKNHASTRGYYCKEIIDVLGKNYTYSKVNDKTRKFVNKMGSMVFIKHSKKYPAGHYLLKTKKGWMNPWANYPKINPAKAGFNKKLPGEAQWVIYSK